MGSGGPEGREEGLDVGSLLEGRPVEGTECYRRVQEGLGSL